MDLVSATKVAAAGIAGAGGSGGAVYGTYYLVTYSKSTTQEEEDKETKPKFKELEKWTKDNKCNITSVVSTSPQPNETINFDKLDEDKSEKILAWLKQDTNKNTAGCGTPTTTVVLKTGDWTTFTK